MLAAEAVSVSSLCCEEDVYLVTTLALYKSSRRVSSTSSQPSYWLLSIWSHVDRQLLSPLWPVVSRPTLVVLSFILGILL